MRQTIEQVAGDRPREAALLALLYSMRNEGFLSDALDRWQRVANPSSSDSSLAYEIAAGACRMRLQLDTLLDRVAGRPLTLKRKGRAILHCGAYQLLYLDRIPSHAAVNESVALAKQYGHASLARLVNALLRKLAKVSPDLSADSLSVRTSFPPLFVEELSAQLGEEAEPILHQFNQPPPIMARIRGEAPLPPEWRLYSETPHKIAIAPKGKLPNAILNSPDYVIQNQTSINLLTRATSDLPRVESVLDLCAAPGGKAVLLRDLFPDCQLTVNEPSSGRLKRLQENLTKYDIEADVTRLRGEEYPIDQKFDLVVVDAPCSNSGVLHKRPEARWRLTEEHLSSLVTLQKALVERALQLVTPGGVVCYLTCSILDRENCAIVEKYDPLFSEQILPSEDGVDGGFAATLQCKE